MSLSIHLDASDVRRCLDFAKKAAPVTQEIEFGQEDTKKRDLDERARDIFVGKLGELAVQKQFLQYGLKTFVDFNIYKRGEWDKADVIYKRSNATEWNIDVKCTKMQSQFFLIEWKKLQFRKKGKELPQVFAITQVDNDARYLKVAPKGGMDVVLSGYVYLPRLEPGHEKTLIVRKGSLLPTGRGPQMQADNLAIYIHDLEHDWEALAMRFKHEDPFDTSSFHVPTETEEDFLQHLSPVPADEGHVPELQDFQARSHYSILLSGKTALEVTPEKLVQYFRAGIKCLLFLPQKRAEALADRFYGAYGSSCFQVFAPANEANLPDLFIVDGKMSRDEYGKASLLGHMPYATDVAHRLRDFNWEQYQVEHAPATGNMIVRASAGTGKTTVMMDRVLFLLGTVEGIQPKDIGMITFTNAAAEHMMEKIQERLEAFYRETGQPRFFLWMEHLSEMRIQTIDSFFKRLIGDAGNWIGFGNSASIRGFIREKKDALEETLDQLWRCSAKKTGKTFLDVFLMKRSDYIKYAYEFWRQFNSRGYYADDIEKMDFGLMLCENADSEYEKDDAGNYKKIAPIMQQLIVGAERCYQAIKLRENAYSLSDIKAEMDALTKTECAGLRTTKLRFLFIDEFQDTDNSQIKTIAWLQRLLACQLFVVGDVKQSIYRFRGAEENAFDELKRHLALNGKNEIRQYVLRKNYRTVSGVLNNLNQEFLKMGEMKVLPYTKDESVQPCITGVGCIHGERLKNRKDVKAATVNLLKSCLNDKKKVAVLCRSNSEAAEIDDACRSQGISCLVRRSGGFYQCLAVRHFLALLRMLFYPEDAASLYGFAITPYVRCIPDSEEMEKYAGQYEMQRKYLSGILRVEGWDKIRQEMPRVPAFPFLFNIVLGCQPVKRYHARRSAGFPLYEDSDDEKIDVLMYEKNLNKLFQVLYDRFSGDFASLLDIYDFLNQQVSTDDKEDLLYPEPDEMAQNIVEIMTVHKAKGLEFQTVILPYTGDAFARSEDDDESYTALITEHAESSRVGIMFHHRGNILNNSYYKEMRGDEELAEKREGARLLYVAATRCKEQFFYFTEKWHQQNCWGEWLKDWKRQG